MSTSETYTLSGATDFTFSHPVRLASQLTVEVIPGGVVSSSDYEVIGAGPAATGVTVRYSGAPTDGTKTLKITRYVEPTRVSDFTGAAGITVTGLEAEFDNVYRSIEDLQTTGGVSAPVVAATTANITLSGTQTIDGVSVVAGDRVLVKDQTDTTENGVWICQSDAWYRATDWDQDGEVLNGTLVLDTNQAVLYKAEFTGAYDPGTTAVTFGPGVLADGAVVTATLADGAVTTPKLANGAVTIDKVGFDPLVTATSSSDPSLSVNTWRTPNANRPVHVLVAGQASTDGAIAGYLLASVDESGGTTADYGFYVAYADEALGSGGIDLGSASFVVPPGGAYQVFSANSGGNNNLSPVRETVM